MKNLFTYLFLLLLFTASGSFGQAGKSNSRAARSARDTSTSFIFQKLIPGNFIALDVDILDNLYLITENNQLRKLNANADSVAAFNEVAKYGNPTLIDVSNPLKILVYYKGFSTAVILDRLLTVRNTINFRKQNIFRVQSICTSYDNNIWLFDEQDFKLKKIDDEGNLLQESTDMRLLVDSVPSPEKLTDNDNFIYLYDKNRGFYIFDYYGALKSNLPFLGWSNTAIAHNRIYGFSGNKLYSYELSSLNLKQYELPPFMKGYSAIKAINGKLYILKPEGVEVYLVK